MSKKNKNWKKNKLQVQRTETENGKTANPKKETIPAYNLTNKVRHYDVVKETTQNDIYDWPTPTEHKNTKSRKALWYTVNGKFRCLM